MERILVVDDHEVDRYRLQQVLGGRGYRVETAADGVEALSAARRTPPALIVSDVFMPAMDGFALCRAVRHDDTLADVPFVFYTATYVGPENERLALALGADRFLIKPLDPRVLADEVETVLALGRAGVLAAARQPSLPDEGFHVEYVGAVTRKLEEKVAQLETANLQLTEANAHLERFAYVASHDLREPLRTIISFSQLLQRRYRGRLDPEADDFIDLVVDAALRMDSLTRDLLVFSRVSSDTHPFDPVDLARVCDVAVGNLRDAIDEAGARVDRPPLPVVHGDESQLVQLFQNLIGNAVKFRRPGQAPHVVVGVEATAREWLFAVTDTEQHVFENSPRHHPQRDYPAPGVGQAISKRVVSHHGGRIWVERPPGGGTTIRFTLPTRGAGGEGE